jgi:hypothetical protein
MSSDTRTVVSEDHLAMVYKNRQNSLGLKTSRLYLVSFNEDDSFLSIHLLYPIRPIPSDLRRRIVRLSYWRKIVQRSRSGSMVRHLTLTQQSRVRKSGTSQPTGKLSK